MREFVEYMVSFNKDLITVLQQFWIFIALIALFSCFFTQAVKKSDSEVFLKKNLTSFQYWLTNIVFSLMITVFIILVFDGLDSVWKTISYIFLNWVFGWVLSVLGYDYFLKYLFKILEIGDLKLDSIINSIKLENMRIKDLYNKNKLERGLDEQSNRDIQ